MRASEIVPPKPKLPCSGERACHAWVVIPVPLRSAPFAVVKQAGGHMTPASARGEPCLALYVLLLPTLCRANSFTGSRRRAPEATCRRARPVESTLQVARDGQHWCHERKLAG